MLHEKDVYDKIADYFSDIRYCIWNFVAWCFIVCALECIGFKKI